MRSASWYRLTPKSSAAFPWEMRCSRTRVMTSASLALADKSSRSNVLSISSGRLTSIECAMRVLFGSGVGGRPTGPAQCRYCALSHDPRRALRLQGTRHRMHPFTARRSELPRGPRGVEDRLMDAPRGDAVAHRV